jgi:hypothetical protein
LLNGKGFLLGWWKSSRTREEWCLYSTSVLNAPELLTWKWWRWYMFCQMCLPQVKKRYDPICLFLSLLPDLLGSYFLKKSLPSPVP